MDAPCPRGCHLGPPGSRCPECVARAAAQAEGARLALTPPIVSPYATPARSAGPMTSASRGSSASAHADADGEPEAPSIAEQAAAIGGTLFLASLAMPTQVACLGVLAYAGWRIRAHRAAGTRPHWTLWAVAGIAAGGFVLVFVPGA